MNAPHLAWFFPPSNSALGLQNTEEFAPDASRFLICGPQATGNTSLLMGLAFTLAFIGKRVMVLADKERLEDSEFAPPPNRDDPRLDNIVIKYVSGYQDVIRWTNCVQKLPAPFHAVLVDSLSHLMSSVRDSNRQQSEFSRMLAYLHESALFMDSQLRNTRDGPCIIACTDYADPHTSHRYEWIANRWLPIILRSRPLTPPGAPSAAFGLTVQCSDPAMKGPPPNLQIEYVAGPGELKLTGLRQVQLPAPGGPIMHHHD